MKHLVHANCMNGSTGAGVMPGSSKFSRLKGLHRLSSTGSDEEETLCSYSSGNVVLYGQHRHRAIAALTDKCTIQIV